MKASLIVGCVGLAFTCSLTALYTFLTVYHRGYNYLMEMFFENITPFVWATLGITTCMAVSIAGAALGIYTIGVSIVGAGVLAPRIKTRNLISIIFCEVVGIYGLIMAIFMTGSYEAATIRDKYILAYNSYLVFGSGLIVGGVNFVCGLAVGNAGSAIALLDAANEDAFMKVLVVEIFASCLGIYGLITSMLLMSKRL